LWEIALKKSKRWLDGAEQLCCEICQEDGVDPRILARTFQSKPKNRKNQQLCKKVKQTLSLVLAGDLGDPVLQNLEVNDVKMNNDGQFLFILVSCINAGLARDEEKIAKKLQVIQGYLRSAVAQSVRRKHVPVLKFVLTKTPEGGGSYAY